MRLRPGDLLRSLLGIGLAAGACWFLVPLAAHTSWGEIGSALGQVHPTVALALLGVTLLALYGYTFVLTGAMPGLTHWQGLLVNVMGSAAGNLLPGGGVNLREEGQAIREPGGEWVEVWAGESYFHGPAQARVRAAELGEVGIRVNCIAPGPAPRS